MSILSEILNEEYERTLEAISSFERAASELPKGTVREKKIKGRVYYYLQWRDGAKVVSRYIKPLELPDIRKAVARRKKYESTIREMNRSKREFEKVIGKNL